MRAEWLVSGIVYVRNCLHRRAPSPAPKRRPFWIVCVIAEVIVYVGSLAPAYFVSPAYDYIQDYILSPTGPVFYILLSQHIKESVRLSNSDFFIYLFHGIISSCVIKAVSMLHSVGFMPVFGCYVLNFIIISLLAILAYFTCLKLFSSATKILVGNRIRRL
ncbi:MAG: hypothetical protein K2M06_00700 [Muribaculaceae bacterium]|nr:hypothetical protein [Muribaculaceae bacterium]